MLRASWNAAFVEEAAAFPRGVHDDQIDALSLAFSKLEQTDLSIWLRLENPHLAAGNKLGKSRRARGGAGLDMPARARHVTHPTPACLIGTVVIACAASRMASCGITTVRAANQGVQGS
jgi:hypothetical protein